MIIGPVAFYDAILSRLKLIDVGTGRAKHIRHALSKPVRREILIYAQVRPRASDRRERRRQTAFAAHVASPHFAVADELMAMADGFVATKGFLVEGIPRAGRGAYHVISHHAVPEAEQKAWLDGVSFPRAAGCVGYDVVRATDAADHFVVIESWPSKDARLAHTLETDGYEEAVYSDATLEAVFRGLACT